MSRSIAENLRAAFAGHAMAAPGDLVVVGVSGGPDSLCLIHVLHWLRGELGIALHVAHLDHMLRAESAAEAEFVAALARGWGLPITRAKVDVRAQAMGANLHAAGRLARYHFLAQVAHAQGARAVAVAHHADDQAETVLMHLLRGAGSTGLRGMRPVVPWEEWGMGDGEWKMEAASQPPTPNPQPLLIRPLLQVTRAEIEAYCIAHGLEPLRDASNDDLRSTRNRIRHELLPQLIEYNPHIVAALRRTAAISADEQDLLERLLAAAWPTLVHERPGAADFDGATWRALHPALQRLALRRAYARLTSAETLGMEHVELGRTAVAGGVGGRAELPGGVVLTVGYQGFTLGAPPVLQEPQLLGESIALPEPPCQAELAVGWTIEASEAEFAPLGNGARLLEQAEFDANRIAGPLIVRRRRPGDRFRPVGAPGRRRLQDMFVDAKVPRALRAAWPVVTDGDAIVWVPGLRAPAEFVATATTRRVLRLRIVRHA
jgi:tRNA(Ile)-lysidine synthetase-like protein